MLDFSLLRGRVVFNQLQALVGATSLQGARFASESNDDTVNGHPYG